MSVANQANEKLTQLVTLTAKIESYLNPAKKGKGGGQAGAQVAGDGATGGGGANRIKEAIAVGGMAQSLAMFFKEYTKSKLGDGEKVKQLLINLSDGMRQAYDKIKEIDEKEMLNKISTVIKGIAGFSLTMVLLSLAAVPFALGILVFSLGISAMNMIFNLLVKDTKKTDEALGIIGKIGQGAALFTLAMVLIGYTAPAFALGVIVFTLAVSGMLLVFSLLGSTKVKKTVTDSMQIIFDMAKGAAFFALSMILIGITAPLFAFGVIVFTLAISAMILVFSLLNGVKKQVRDSLQLILSMSKDIAIFALTMTLVGLVAPLFALGTIVFTLALAAVMGVLILAGKFDKQLNKGTKALDMMAIPIAILAGVFLVVGLVYEPVLKGAATMAASILLVGTATALIGMMDKNVKKGIKTLDQMILPVLAFAGALLIIGLIPTDPLDLLLKVGVMAAAITVLGLAAFVLGLPAVAPFATAGAAVLVTLTMPMIVFAAALFIISKATFTQESITNLGRAISVIGVAMAGMGLLSPFILLGSAVMAVAAVALLPITASLAIFKTIGWKESDGESLKNALQSTVQAFSHALDGVGITGMFKLLAAIPIVALLGGALTSLALGIKAMATMTFTEMEWDEKAGKLIPKRQVKLTDAEIQAVGPNVAAILNALADPLLEFGKKAAQGPFSLFGGGFMAQGIKAAAGVGEVISSLAKGVADMAKLNVVEYTVKNGKLVPKSVRKLTPLDFMLAGINTGMILDALAVPLTRFGMYASLGEGIFSSGYMEKGIEAASKVGNAIASIAKGVSDMANLTVVENQVKDGKLVPKSVRQLTDADFTLAGENVGKILKALVVPLTEFGKAWEDGSSWFSNSYLESAVKGISAVTDPISKLAKMITELASGNAVVSEVKDGKLVPKQAISFADAVPKATAAISELLTALPKSLTAFGQSYENDKDAITSGIDAIGIIAGSVNKIADFGKNYINRKTDIEGSIEGAQKLVPASSDMVKILKNYAKMKEAVSESSSGGLFGLFGGNDSKLIDIFTEISEGLIAIQPGLKVIQPAQITSFSNLTSVIERLSRVVSPFERFTKAFGTFSKDMGVFTKNWKQFTDKDAKNFKIYGDVTDKISKVDVGKLKQALDALIVYERDKIAIEKERAKIVKDIAASGGDTSSNPLEKIGNMLDSLLGGGGDGGKESGKGGPISTPKIQVNGSIYVSGNIDKA